MQVVASLLAVAVLACGCAKNYYDLYRELNPSWEGTPPARGASLEQTVAAIYAPPAAKYRRIVEAVVLLRRQDAAWAQVPLEALVRGAFVPGPEGTYAVVARVLCTSTDGRTHFGRSLVSQYLLPANELAAEDHWEFSEHCVVFNSYEPATGALVELERDLVERAGRESGPGSSPHFYYQKGLKLVAVGRLDDAAAMLEAGDRHAVYTGARPNFDPGRAVAGMASASETAPAAG